MRRVLWQLVTIGCACLVLVACGGGSATDEVTPTSVSTPVSTPDSPENMPLTIGQIQWAAETNPDTGAPVAEVDAFITESPVIVALIQAENLPAGTVFTATWTLNDAPIAGADMQVIAEDDMSTAWISFRFTREDDRRYPVGQLGVTITASDGTLRESSVPIGFP